MVSTYIKRLKKATVYNCFEHLSTYGRKQQYIICLKICQQMGESNRKWLPSTYIHTLKKATVYYWFELISTYWRRQQYIVGSNLYQHIEEGNCFIGLNLYQEIEESNSIWLVWTYIYILKKASVKNWFELISTYWRRQQYIIGLNLYQHIEEGNCLIGVNLYLHIEECNRI